METTPKSWQKRSLATCLQPFFGFQSALGQIQQWHCFTTHVSTSWLEIFLATLFSQQQCHPFSQGELGTCLCRQLSTFFLLIWRVVGASGMHVRSMTGLGYDLLSWPVQLLEPVNEKKCQGWRGCTLRSLCLDNLGTCRKLTEFQGQLHTFFVDPWRSQSLDVFICTVFDIVPVLQLNHQPCNYPSCSTDTDIRVGRQWPDTRTPVKKIHKTQHRSIQWRNIWGWNYCASKSGGWEYSKRLDLCPIYSVTKCVESTDDEQGLYNRENNHQNLPKIRMMALDICQFLSRTSRLLRWEGTQRMKCCNWNKCTQT